MSTATLAPLNGAEVQPFIRDEQIELIKHTVMKGASDLELDLFLNLCRAKMLDPLTKQIYAIKTNQGFQMFASIDGLRVIAQRSGEYEGQAGPFWCGDDGEWTDVWLQHEAPRAAKVGIWRRGFREPTWGVATFESYGKGKAAPIWRSMPDVMLAKAAESMALRKAFPADMSGLYVREEFNEEPSHRRPTDRQEDLLDTAWQARESMQRHTAANELDEAIASGALGVVAGEMARVIDAETGEIETLQSVKMEIQRLVREAEWSDEDMALQAKELELPSWRALTLEQAQRLRDEIRVQMDANEGIGRLDPDLEAFIEAEVNRTGEAGNDPPTR